jgi:hypothetical protein
MQEYAVNDLYSPTFKTFTETICSFVNSTFPNSAPLWVNRLTANFTPCYPPLLAKLEVQGA